MANIIGIAAKTVKAGDLVSIDSHGNICPANVFAQESTHTPVYYWEELKLDCSDFLESEKRSLRERAAVQKAKLRFRGDPIECDFTDREFGQLVELTKALILSIAGVDPLQPMKMRSDPMRRRIIVMNGIAAEEHPIVWDEMETIDTAAWGRIIGFAADKNKVSFIPSLSVRISDER